eukprot:33630-Pelagomonas_calceolata.AAC.4
MLRADFHLQSASFNLIELFRLAQRSAVTLDQTSRHTVLKNQAAHVHGVARRGIVHGLILSMSLVVQHSGAVWPVLTGKTEQWGRAMPNMPRTTPSSTEAPRSLQDVIPGAAYSIQVLAGSFIL